MIDPTRCDEFANLLRQSSAQILAYLHALLLDWNDAEDVFQESCLVLWDKFEEFERGTNFLGWAIPDCAAQGDAPSTQPGAADAAALETRTARVPDDGRLQRDTAAVNEGLAALARCMDRLADADRRLVERCYGEREPVPQVAAELGRLPESVYNSLRRIRTLLLSCMNEVRENDP